MDINRYSATDRGEPSLGSRRIALVTETFAPEINGVANTLHYLCEGLLARHHHVTVIRPAPGKAAVARLAGIGRPLPSPEHYQEIIVPGLPLPGYAELRLGLPVGGILRRLWRASPPDAIYLATQGPLGWSAMKAANALGIPVCAGFHTNFQSYSRYYGVGFLERLVSAYLRSFHNDVGLTLVPTRKTQSRVEKMGIRNTALWSRGVDCDRFGPALRCETLRIQWGLDEADLAVLYVGRLAAEKNLLQAVATFERVRAIHSRARFILVGDGPLRERLQLRHPDYIFCGMRQDQDLARHFASGDILLFPSKTDTFGNVVTEAMASGLAVVAFDEGAACEHIEDSATGMKVALDNDEGFTQAALRLADQPSLRRRIRKAARTKALTLHWAQLIEQFEHLIFRSRPEVHAHANEQSLPTL